MTLSSLMPDTGNTRISNDLAEITDCVVREPTFKDALRSFANHIALRGYKLSYVASRGVSMQNPPKTVYSDVSGSLEAMCAQFGVERGCPIVQKAMETAVPFEALSSDFSRFKDFSDRRYLSELRQLGHNEIGVVPIRIGQVLFTIVVGMKDKAFSGFRRDDVVATVSQFFAAAAVKYSEISAEQSDHLGKCLTDRELECISWCANGKSSFEISRILSLSEHTVNAYIIVACRKLDADNRPHAIAKAMKFGLISGSDIG